MSHPLDRYEDPRFPEYGFRGIDCECGSGPFTDAGSVERHRQQWHPGHADDLTAVEDAWYDLTKGELQLTETDTPDLPLIALVQAMMASAREYVTTVDTDQFGPSGETIDSVDTAEYARRVAESLSLLWYGVK